MVEEYSIQDEIDEVADGEDGIVIDNNGTVNWLEGKLDEDPLFVDIENNDFHLTEDSPCIDAGNPAPEYDDVDGTRNDMGTYEDPNGLTSSVRFIYPLLTEKYILL